MSSCTRTRNLLVASCANDKLVREQIEDTICGHGYTPEHIPIWLALAKAAPVKSEARAAAQIDARMCLLLE